ncbi:MAG: T9SS type A sorting domain-containing protein [Candidatus Hatepunaea meridiana]|nr:T9SS type A sorting domain-containing protein [Candidatus Hatepunaea meridiana]
MQLKNKTLFSATIIAMLLCMIFYVPSNVSACTIGVASGNATADGRPMLWKSRDVTNYLQEFHYCDEEGTIPFISVTYSGELAKYYGGVNAAGFAIGNSDSYNLGASSGYDDGRIHKKALETCLTVDDFADILDSLINEAGGVLLNSNYGVIDAFGGAAMFECATYSYTRYNASEEGGFIVRANYSYSGDLSNHDNLVAWGLFRHDRAFSLWNDAANGNTLTPQYIFRHVARDLAIEGADPYPLPYDGQIGDYPYGSIPNAQAICRNKTRSVVVVQGVPNNEDPDDAVLWTMCGNPLASVPLPLWVRAGSVPVEFDGNNGSLICDRGAELADWICDYVNPDSVVNTWKLTNPLGNGLWDDIFPLSDGVFNDVNTFTNSEDYNDDNLVQAFQNDMATLIYNDLVTWQPTIPEWTNVPEAVNGDEESLIEFTVVGADADGDLLTIAFNSGGLPETAEFTDNGDGTGDFYWLTDLASAGDYTATFTLSDAIYSVDAVVPIHVSGAPGPEEAFASSETTISGSVQGNYTNTTGSDDSYEILTEISSNNNPAKRRYSLLEHVWTFEITGSALELHAEAYRSANNEGDNFILAGSFDGQNYTNLITVASDNEAEETAQIDGDAYGQYYVRVTDTDHTAANLSFDSFYLDMLSITYTTGDVPNRAPVWMDVPVEVTGYPDTPIEFSVTGTDPENDDLTITLIGEGDLNHTGNGTADFSWTPFELGDVTATFRISDGEYNVDTDVTIHVVEAQEPGTMIVSAIDLTENVINRNFTTCIGVITILDPSDAAVSGAVVSAAWSDLYSANVQGTTDENGQVTFQTEYVRNPNGYFTLTITNVTKVDWTYDPDNSVTTAELGVGDVGAGWGGLTLNPGEPVPEVVILNPAYPNPFNDYTTIRFGLPEDEKVRITVYDMMGRRVATLTDRYANAGWHSTIWTPRLLANGEYIVRMESSEFVKTRRIVFLK